MTTEQLPLNPTNRAIDILHNLVGFNTVSSNSNLALMEYAVDLLKGIGAEVKLLPNAEGSKANLYARIGPSKANGLILSGHTDVVPVTGQDWSCDPFTLTKKGKRLYGRGTADMKSFMACSLAALEFFDTSQLKRPIHLAFSYDEEIGCLGSPDLIKYIASNIDLPASVIIGEPTEMGIVGAHKSVHIFEVKVTGVPAHSSSEHGVSANRFAIRLMSRLMDIADSLKKPNFQNSKFDPPFSTLTIGKMEGGTAANILAAKASFVFDLRSLPELSMQEVLAPFFADIEAIQKAHSDVGILCTPLATVPALAPLPDGSAEDLVRAALGDKLEMRTVSFGAEAGQFQEAGFSTVMCGPGSMDQGHQTDEYIEISEIEKCVNFMDRLFTAASKVDIQK